MAHVSWIGGASSADADEATSEGEKLSPDDLLRLISAQAAEGRERYLAREAEYPQEWQDAAGRDQMHLRVTAEELERLRWAYRQLAAGLVSGRPASPEGAERVEVAIDYTPLFQPQVRHDR